MKKTKIICTLGPASEEISTIKRMILAGMNCARVNFSHGNYENFDKIIKNIRQASSELNRPIALIQDLQGPKIRIGKLPPEGINLKKHQKIILTVKNSYKPTSLQTYIPIQYKHLPKDVKANDLILFDDGFIEAKVIKTNSKDQIECKILNSGILKSNKGINIPGGKISTPAITKKDLQDLKFGLKYDFDYIALSFVKSEQDIIELKKILKKFKSQAKIIAKIERAIAIENIEKIIQETDAIMVARGDLGLETDAEKLPIIQKEIIHLGNIYGKPTIIATQMLSSMIENPRATRAEITDIATAVFDHADALMLSNETAVGKYPIQAVKTLSKVAQTVEKELKEKGHLLPNLLKNKDMPIINATCLNACKLAEDIRANAIIVLTDLGETARLIAKYRIYIPIITFCKNYKTHNQLSLIWGINKIFPLKNLDETEIIHLLRTKKLLKKGDEVVIVHISKNKNIISTKII